MRGYFIRTQINQNLQNKLADIDEINKAVERCLEELKAENEYLKTVINSRISNGETMVEKETEDGIDDKDIDDCSTEDAEEFFLKEAANNKCKKCDFIGKSEAGLKIHVKAKHKEKPLFQRFSRVGENKD